MAKTTFPIEQTTGLNFTETTIEIPFGEGKTLKLSTGKLAKQAAAAVLAQVGETVVLVACVMSDKESPLDFFPLLVDYREKFYAGGRIPGGFFKREARPSDGETLNARLIDRTIRPLFPDGYRNEVQVYVTVLATDLENKPELIAMCAAGAALHISKIPLLKPIAGVRMGCIDGKLVVNPTTTELEETTLDLIVAGHADGMNMVECGAAEVSEDLMIDALEKGHDAIRTICAAADALRAKVGQEKVTVTPKEVNTELKAAVDKLMVPHLKEIAGTYGKKERDERVKLAKTEIRAALAEKYPEMEDAIGNFVYAADEHAMRRCVAKDGIRADGRGLKDIRPIWSETDSLPRVHGSAIFTRGQTQALAVVTLGSMKEQQMVDDMTGVSFKGFLLHYNFPSYSVGEAKRPAGPGRREIGHGALAERALRPLVPTKEEFPYTIRLVVEILESNGSSSMATVCSGSMALMDAGVPMKRPVAGIAMGLITDDDGNMAVISDIQGIEDHCGDMDFKVTGTTEGITALQMDIKIEGVSRELLAKALRQAKEGRDHILAKMAETITAPREELKPQAPRVTIIRIPTDKIREVIGSGGKVIREIVEVSGAQVDIEDDGTAYIMASDKAASDKALEMISMIISDLEEGSIITGTVKRIIDSGAIVEFGPGKDGMIHISELEHRRVERVSDVLSEGDMVTVKVVEVDKARGRVRLSRKALIPNDNPVHDEENGGGDRGGDFGGDRGGRRDRGGDRGPGGGRPRLPRPPRRD